MLIAPSRRLLASCLIALCAAGAALAQSSPSGEPLASGRLEIRGSRLTLYSNTASGVSDAEQTINIGERATVRTCFGGPTVPCGSVAAGDPRVAGLAVLAELSGPELPEPLVLATVPGGAFVLPSFQQPGDYLLENIRMVSGDGAASQVISLSDPSFALLQVRKIVLTSASVTALTLEELRARGIQINEESFQAFDFAVGFAFGSEVVKIHFPVTFEGRSSIGGYGKPEVNLDALPPGLVAEVERWSPPNIVPFRLVIPEKPPAEGLDIGSEEDEDLEFPVYGVIVIPGTVTYLNQFFDASLMVANGAPGNSGATLRNLRAAIRLPGNNALRLARTEPPVSPGQEVPVLTEDGSQVLAPGEKAKASWTVEGLKPGTHGLIIDLEGDLWRPGHEPLPVASRSQAAVEVVDARFHLTFSHPEVVRRDERYTLYVTVANESLATQNLITVELKRNNLSGAHPYSADDDLRREITTLGPGESETIEYELVSDVTGQVVATTFQADSNAGLGTIQLRAGVGELGIPLSPATLVLPRYSSDLKELAGEELLRANNRLLGLAYSLAVAPASALPPGIGGISKQAVERRALDIGEAGQRIFLGENLLESLEVLALDQLGNREQLAGYDQLRRMLSKGLQAGDELAKVLRAEQQRRGLSAAALFDHFAGTTSYAEPFLAAVAIPTAAGGALDLEIRGKTGAEGRLAFASEDETRALRTLPYGEIYKVHAEVGPSSPDASFGLVGHVRQEEVYTVEIANPLSVEVTSRLLLMVPEPAGSGFRRVDFGVVSLPAGGRLAVDVGGNLALRLYDPVSLAQRPEAPAIGSIALPPFEIIGVRQEFELIHTVDGMGNHDIPNRYGNGLTYLFNRPPASTIAARPAAWRVVSTFDGEDILGNDVNGTTDKLADSVFIQDSERVVNVRYSGSISPLFSEQDGITPLVAHEHRLTTADIVDRSGNPVLSQVPAIRLERSPAHEGGLVGGRVLRGNGEGAAGAVVQLIRQREFIVRDGTVVKYDVTAETVTDDDGNYFFDFVEFPLLEPVIRRTFLLKATVPAGADPVTEPADIEQVGSIIRLNNRMAVVNIALLGRGAVYGHLKYADTQQPVAGGKVEAASTLFDDLRSVDVGADGSFRIDGVAVGPVTLTGRDGHGRTVYATVEVATSGAEVGVELQMPRSAPPGVGTVRGKVTILRGSQNIPAAGARVACYAGGQLFATRSAGEDGSFIFPAVPAGQISLQAADFRISRTAVLQDELLPVGGAIDALLRIPESVLKTVVGEVKLRNLENGTLQLLPGATVFIPGPGVFTKTDENGRYVLPGVPSQSADEADYVVRVIDFALGLEGSAGLPHLVDATPDPVFAETIILETGSTVGGVRGRVFDPQGNPVGGVDLVLYPLREGVTSAADGTFYFPQVPGGAYDVVAHVDDGLQAGRFGYFGKATAYVSYSGHEPFIRVNLGGAGTVKLKTKTSTSTGILTPIYYKPTYYSQAEKNIRLRGQYIDTSTNPNGDIEIPMPVGDFEIVAYNPFHGVKTIRGRIDFNGQLIDQTIVFEDAGKVRGQVVGPDGVTPVPFAEVVMRTEAFLPQPQIADALGQFEFFLVPKGPVDLRARGLDGAVERVGSTLTYITLGGQEIDVKVQLKRQGSVAGRVVEIAGGQKIPVAHAQYAIYENSYPFRRFPGDGTYYVADAEGRYELSSLFAGPVTVVGRDPLQPSRSAQTGGEIVADWQRLELADIEFKNDLEVGRLEILVHDSVTGAPVPDAQVKLSNEEMTVTGADGKAIFESLRVGTYAVYAFFAPSGRSGRAAGLMLAHGGDVVTKTVDLDQRGKVSGRVWDSTAFTTPVPGAVVELRAQTAGGYVVALATARTDAENLGRFEFLGIPESQFQLTAADVVTPRRAALAAALTATSPELDVNLVLEPLRSVYLRLYEKLTAGVAAVDTENSLFSVRLLQVNARGLGNNYDFTRLEPEPSGSFFFPDLLLERSADFRARELTGDQRTGFATAPRLLPPLANLPGAGTAADPFRLTLEPRGVVKVAVRLDSGDAAPAGITVRLGGRALATDGEGNATFVAVPAGTQVATATHPSTGQGGSAAGQLVYDDQELQLTVTLAPAVSATGVIYQPSPGDIDVLDPATQLPPMAGAVVQLRDSSGRSQAQLTDSSGRYRFDALKNGLYQIVARNNDGDWEVASSGNLQGNDGAVIELPSLVLDASPPRLVSIEPAPGLTLVPVDANLKITFSERLHNNVLPSGFSSSIFELRLGNAVVAGTWHYDTVAGRQVVYFEPAAPLENDTVYSVWIRGGNLGVIDRQGRLLTTANSVGSSFRTGDSRGPAIIATLPRLDRPVEPAVPLRFDFSEKLVATAELLDGDAFEDAALLEAQRLDGSWVTLPLVLYLTRNDYSLQVETFAGVGLPPAQDSGRRRMTVSRLKDAGGNAMEPKVYLFRLFDGHAPELVELPRPQNAPDGNLYHGTGYSLAPVIQGLDDLSPENPRGDLDRVEYYLNDPDQPGVTPQLARTATTYPFTFEFQGVHVIVGNDPSLPRPFPIWARAYDTSRNASATRKVDMQVLPNLPPLAGQVLLAPAGAALYPGNTAVATASGFADADGTQLNLTIKIVRQDGTLLGPAFPAVVSRPPAGWGAASPVTFSLRVPDSVPEGELLRAVCEVRDGQGALATATSEPLAVADDDRPPKLANARIGDAFGFVNPPYELGSQIQAVIEASDAESRVTVVRVSFEPQIFGAEPLVLQALSNGTTYRLASPRLLTAYLPETTEIAATFEVEDLGGNVAQATFTFAAQPTADPTPTLLHWSSPFDGAKWPAAYSSILGSTSPGVPLLLRVASLEEGWTPPGSVPRSGEILGLEVRTPARQPDGSFTLEAEWQAAEKVAGGGEPNRADWQLLWTVPNDIPAGTVLPFEVRAWNSGGHLTVATASLVAAPYRKVYEGVRTTIAATDAMIAEGGDPDGPVFLVGGTTLSLQPQAGGAFRRLPGLFLYAGGKRELGVLEVEPSGLTTPEITTLSSTVLYNPLELEISGQLGLGAATSINLEGHGLPGGKKATSTETGEAVLPGIRGAGPAAGGSHGGSGLPGYRSSTNPAPTEPGEVYDDLRQPRLPGGGGRSDNAIPAGNGGGVLRIHGGATLQLEGELLARAATVTSNSPGGAGGAIDLALARLAGWGRIDASGALGGLDGIQGFGGGGRIAIRYREVAADFDWYRQVVARGGSTTQRAGEGVDRSGGGGGTIYRELLPESGPASGLGTLQIANHDLSADTYVTKVIFPTPLPGVGEGRLHAVDPATSSLVLDVPAVLAEVAGERLVVAAGDHDLGTFGIAAASRVAAPEAAGGFRVRLELVASAAELEPLATRLANGEELRFRGLARFLDIVARGSARIYTDSDLELGPLGALNDRAFIDASSASRVLLRGEGTTLTPPFPAETTSVRPGQVAFQPDWRLDNGLGLHQLKVSFGARVSNMVLTGWPTSVEEGYASLDLRVAIDAAPGPIDYTVEATDLRGRKATFVRHFEVVANEPPTISVTSGPSAIRVGTGGNFQVSLADSDGLAAAGCELAEPTTGVYISPASPKTISGTVAGAQWGVVPTAEATATSFELVFWVQDLQGLRTEARRTVQITRGGAPTGTLSLVPAGAAGIQPGRPIEVMADLQDADGDLNEVRVHFDGPVQIASHTGFIPSSSGGAVIRSFETNLLNNAQPGAIITITGEVEDRVGNITALGPLTVTVLADSTPPGLGFYADEGSPTYFRDTWYPGQLIEIQILAFDNVAVTFLEASFLDETFSAEVTSNEYGSYIHTFYYQVPGDLEEPFDAVIHARTVDAAGNEFERDSEPLHFLPDRPPTFELALSPDTDVQAGADVALTLAAHDDRGLTDQVHLMVTGTGVSIDEWVTYSSLGGGGFTGGAVGGEATLAVAPKAGPNETLSYRFQVPDYVPDGTQLQVTVVVEDVSGHQMEQVRALNVVAPNTVPPAARIYLQPAADGDRYEGGQSLTVIATARGKRGATPLTLHLPASQLNGQGYAKATLALPVVTAPTPLDIEVTTVDGGGLEGAKLRRITILPAADPGKPWVRFACPTTGALLPAGDSFVFSLAAGDDAALASLELREVGADAPPFTWDPAGAPDFTATATVALGAGAGTRTYEARATDGAGNVATATIAIEVAAAVELDAGGTNDWTALESQVAVLREGILTLEEPRHFRGLIVLNGASITHPAFATGTEGIKVTVDEALYVACGATIDAVGRGASQYFYSPADPGSHIGRRGGQTQQGRTYGSIKEPREAGTAGQTTYWGPGSGGGGVVRLEAARLVVDGAIDASGTGNPDVPGCGSGGSVWLVASGPVSGAGTIAAKGGSTENTSGQAGGGGAIAIHGALAADLASRCSVAGGDHLYNPGGAGSVFVQRPGQADGELIVKGPAGTSAPPVFELPSLFSQSQATAAYLSAAAPPAANGTVDAYLGALTSWADHFWLEVRNEYQNYSKGFYFAERLEGELFRLYSETGRVALFGDGDFFRPYYTFAGWRLSGNLLLDSSPGAATRSSGAMVVDGKLDSDQLATGSLELLPGAILGPRVPTGGESRRLVVEAEDVVLSPGAKLDADGRGRFGGSASLASAIGGNHLGLGGESTAATFGNPEIPREGGEGGRGAFGTGNRGGGVLELAAAGVVYLPAGSSAKADGSAGTTGHGAAAGGSVLIRAETRLHLEGAVTARGGAGSFGGPGGGGGAVALQYGSFSGDLDEVDTFGGPGTGGTAGGGAGTVVVHDLDQPRGDLIVDNGSASAQLRTVLPSMGRVHVDYVRNPGSGGYGSGEGGLFEYSGAVACGYVNSYYQNGDRVWVSDLILSETAVGRQIEITGIDPDTGLPTVPQIRRIAVVARNCAGLEDDPSADPLPDGSDLWQGVYAFSNLRIHNAELVSADPLKTDGLASIEGETRLQPAELGALTVRSGGALRPPAPAGSGQAAPALELKVAGELRLEPGAVIDVSGQGLGSSYSAPTGAAGRAGPTHIGVGGGPVNADQGKAYGRVYQPTEPGAGRSGSRGGGVLLLEAGSLVLEGSDSIIRANGDDGTDTTFGAAGGTVAISAGSLSGLGKIEARGGASTVPSGNGSAGGGSISLRYGNAEAGFLARVDARGGAHPSWPGGPGSVLLYDQDSSVFGSLVLANGSAPGVAELPHEAPFGAQDGSEGNRVIRWVSDPLLAPTSLVHNWFRVQRSGVNQGCAWVQSVRASGDYDFDHQGYAVEIVLAYPPGRQFDIAPGDTFGHLYPFDSLAKETTVSARSATDLAVGETEIATLCGTAGWSGLVGTGAPAALASGPASPAARIAIEPAALPGLYRIRIPALDGKAYEAAHLSSRDLRVSAPYDPLHGAELLWAGEPGEVLRLELDAPTGEQKSLALELPALPAHPLATSDASQLEP